MILVLWILKYLEPWLIQNLYIIFYFIVLDFSLQGRDWTAAYSSENEETTGRRENRSGQGWSGTTSSYTEAKRRSRTQKRRTEKRYYPTEHFRCLWLVGVTVCALYWESISSVDSRSLTVSIINCILIVWDFWVEMVTNYLTVKSDQHLISPFNSTPELNLKVMRTKEMITNQEALNCETNSPCQFPGKCVENSLENMHSDVRMWRVKDVLLHKRFEVAKSRLAQLVHQLHSKDNFEIFKPWDVLS